MAEPTERIILALDTDDRDQARAWLERFAEVRRVKVGLQLFLAAGFPFVEELQERGYGIFLDLKLHDIPRTVAAGIAELARREIDLITVHALGGARMIAAARDAVEREGTRTQILAVTVLTAHDAGEWRALNFATDIPESTRRLARLAVGAGAHGIVCSPLEVEDLRGELGPEPLLVTPGVRLPGQRRGDQRRIGGPGMALAAGASYLVVGRALTEAEDPDAAWGELKADLEAAARNEA